MEKQQRILFDLESFKEVVDEEKKIHGGYFTFDEASGALKEFEIKLIRIYLILL